MDKWKLLAIVVIILIIWVLILRSTWNDFDSIDLFGNRGHSQADESAWTTQPASSTRQYRTAGSTASYENDIAPAVTRLLCLVLSADWLEHLDRGRAVMETWGKRCDKLILIHNGTELAEAPVSQRGGDNQAAGAVSVLTVPPSVDGPRDQSWHKLVVALDYLHRNYREEFDWFMQVEDDTYVLVENLKQFLVRSAEPSEPIYFGQKFRPYARRGFMRGGSSYVLSRRALDLLVGEGFVRRLRRCHLEPGLMEDADLSSCLQAAGVAPGDTRDIEGRPRLVPVPPDDLLSQPHLGWISSYSSYESFGHPKSGKECCSQEPMMLHYIEWRQMYLMDWLLYDLKLARPAACSSTRNETAEATTIKSSLHF